MSEQENNGDLAAFNAQVAEYNAQTQTYIGELNQWKQDIGEQQQQNQALAGFIENTGFIGMDVVSRVVGSKPFALFTTFLSKQFGDINLLPKQIVAKAKEALKPVIKKTLGIDLDDPENFVWKQAFEDLDITYSDLKSIYEKKSIAPIQEKLQNQFFKTVQRRAPEIARQVLKSQGINLDEPGNNTYLEQLRESGITLDDLVAAGNGNATPLLNKIGPILKNKAIETIKQRINIPDSEGEDGPFTTALKSITAQDAMKVLKGDYSPVVEKLTPVVKEYVKQQLSEKLGIELPETEGESKIPIQLNDIRRALNGDYGGIVDAFKPQVEKYVKEQLKDRVGIDIDTSKVELGYNDLENLANGRYDLVYKKFAPQIKNIFLIKYKKSMALIWVRLNQHQQLH